MRRARILVTGATGCLGRHVVPLLVARGWDVHACSSRAEPPPDMPVTWHQGNLLDRRVAEHVVDVVRPTSLMHLAWYVAPGKWASSPDNLDWVDASLFLIRRAARTGAARVVVSGSGLEYDWNYGYCHETRTPCTPHTLYGTSKHALRLLAEGAAGVDGFSLAWARVFFLFGAWEHPDRLVPTVIRALLAGRRAQCSHGRQVRDYLHAADVAEALVALLHSDVTGPVNVASGVPVSLRDLATRAATLLGAPDQIDFGAIPAATSDTPLVVADVTRLRTEVDWTPPCDLDRGLAATIDWWRQQASRRE